VNRASLEPSESDMLRALVATALFAAACHRAATPEHPLDRCVARCLDAHFGKIDRRELSPLDSTPVVSCRQQCAEGALSAEKSAAG
jgi:hypothetical protein